MVSHPGIKILLIDDNPNDAELTKVRLGEADTSHSYEFFHVELLSDALAFLHTSSVDVILLDLCLPDAQGAESFRILQANFFDIPIIILSGAKEKALALQVVQEGVQDYILKDRADSELLGHAIGYAIERKKSEKALVTSKTDTERLLASIAYVLIGVDEQDQVIQWNATAEATFGLSALQVLAKSFFDCGIQWDWMKMRPAITNCREGNQPIALHDLLYIGANGKEGFLDLTLTHIRQSHGNSRGFLILGNDITQRKQLESLLRLAQKMESIGQLAAGIAHEINTPSQFVGDNLRFLQDSFCAIQTVLATYAQLFQAVETGQADSQLVDAVKRTMAESDLEFLQEEIPKALKQSLDGANRISNIVRAMKDFSHPGSGKKKHIDLNRAIESTITVARNEWKYVADMVTDLDPALPLVPCQAGEFNQVILNLLINAAHAIGDVVGKEDGRKGTITISSRIEGEWAEVRIADTGTGIPEAARERIFDPFFTTKEVGKGTGQGLAIVHDVIITKHGGTLTVETELAKGTTFVIRLPLQETPVCKET